MKAMQPVITSNEVLYLQIMLVDLHCTSGKEKKGKRYEG
jgi:hypothetical protein